MKEVIIIIILIIIVILLFKSNSEKNDKLKRYPIVSGQKMQELVPFFKDFPYDVRDVDLKFLAMPVDYVMFAKDRIEFIEIKSGNSKLSEKQENIKNLVERGRVYWREIKI
jgi:predicted Holliday junction resolvase-like endonuclease